MTHGCFGVTFRCVERKVNDSCFASVKGTSEPGFCCANFKVLSGSVGYFGTPGFC